jgi:transposase
MVALLLDAYWVGVRSSREIERARHHDVAFRVICAGLLPDHTTVTPFRQRHEEALTSPPRSPTSRTTRHSSTR